MFVKEYTMADEHAFHVKHFCCFECDVPLGGKKYVVKHDQPICLNCCAKKYRKLLYASVWWCTCWLQSGQQGWDVCLSQDSILDIKRKEVVAVGQLDLGLVSVVGSRENEMRIMSFQVMVEVANSKIQECYTCGKLIAVEDQRVSFSYFDWHACSKEKSAVSCQSAPKNPWGYYSCKYFLEEAGDPEFNAFLNKYTNMKIPDE
uniref:LIM zinc-binding domain-containing protein n=1 Tax=Timema douglasi TaxID=61478 RepID=A0A7R8VFS5_TIMDO|nr:unnamed protein product [Timema douglasi]